MDQVNIQRQIISGARPGPGLLITGGVHGDEFTPMAAIRKLATVVAEEDLAGTLTLVPVVNEEAFELRQRTASDSLDLARTCPGRADGSITERTAFAISAMIRSADYLIDLHTGSDTCSILPLTGYTLHTDAEILERQRMMARAFNLPIIWGTSPTLDGRTLSVARDAGVPAIYAEYLGMGICDDDGVTDYVNGCLNVLQALGMIERDTPTSRVERVVEDDDFGSGHMQVQNPAPVSGFFEPVVHLGDEVKAGDAIGTVTNIPGTSVQTVHADRTGLIVGLRTCARIEAGDFAAVIL